MRRSDCGDKRKLTCLPPLNPHTGGTNLWVTVLRVWSREQELRQARMNDPINTYMNTPVSYTHLTLPTTPYV